VRSWPTLRVGTWARPGYPAPDDVVPQRGIGGIAGAFPKPWAKPSPGMKTWPANSLPSWFHTSSRKEFPGIRTLQRGALWAVGRLAEAFPFLLTPLKAGEFILSFLEARDPAVRETPYRPGVPGRGEESSQAERSPPGPEVVRLYRGENSCPGASGNWLKRPSSGSNRSCGDLRRDWAKGIHSKP